MRLPQRSITNSPRPAAERGESGASIAPSQTSASTNHQPRRASLYRRSDFRFGLADSESGSDATRPAWATNRQSAPRLPARRSAVIKQTSVGSRPCYIPANHQRRQRRAGVHAHDPHGLWRSRAHSLDLETWARTGRRTSALSPRPTGLSSSRPWPTPATSTGSRATSEQSQKFVFNKPTTPCWDTARRAVDDYITHRKGTDRDRRISALERKHQIAA